MFWDRKNSMGNSQRRPKGRHRPKSATGTLMLLSVFIICLFSPSCQTSTLYLVTLISILHASSHSQFLPVHVHASFFTSVYFAHALNKPLPIYLPFFFQSLHLHTKNVLSHIHAFVFSPLLKPIHPFVYLSLRTLSDLLPFIPLISQFVCLLCVSKSNQSRIIVSQAIVTKCVMFRCLESPLFVLSRIYPSYSSFPPYISRSTHSSVSLKFCISPRFGPFIIQFDPNQVSPVTHPSV